MTSLMIDMFLLCLLVFIAVMIVRTGKLFAVIVMSGGYSLTSAAIFVNLDAGDVAMDSAMTQNANQEYAPPPPDTGGGEYDPPPPPPPDTGGGEYDAPPPPDDPGAIG